MKEHWERRGNGPWHWMRDREYVAACGFKHSRSHEEKPADYNTSGERCAVCSKVFRIERKEKP